MSVALGSLVRRVDTWNPARQGAGSIIRYVDLGSIDNETKQIQGHQTVPALEAPSRARQLIEAGDVLVSTVRPNLNGVARVPETLGGATASTGFCVLRAGDKLDPSYLFQWVKTPTFVEAMVRRATGQSYPAVSDRIIFESEIPLPPLDEQRRIAAILDQAEALRRKRREALTTQDRLAEAYFHALFGDPMTNPMGWPVRPLGELGELERGVSKHRPRNDPALLGGPYPLIQTGDVANADGIIESYNSTYTEKGLKQSRIWPKGTLCITIAANIGKTATLGFDACFPDSVVGFAPSDRVNIHYIQFLFMSLQEKLEREAPESAQKNINLAILRGLLVPVPPIAIQNRFSAVVERQRATRNASKSHLAQLDALFASLQHRAFRGEL